MTTGGRHLVVVGDALLDRDVDGRVDRLSPDAPVPVIDEPAATTRPGGAGLASALAARDGHDVVLVTALGEDEAGDELRRLLAASDVAVVDLGLRGTTPSKERIHAAGRPVARLDRGGPPGEPGPATAEAVDAVEGAGAVLVADYGRGVAAGEALRDALARRHGPVVWDPHPRGAVPVPGVALATPNAAEAGAGDGRALGAVAARARELVASWRVGAVAVTLGPRGALLSGASGAPLVVPAPPTSGGDPCGAGDRFASAAAAALAAGAVPSEAVEAAVAEASAFVAAGGASAFCALDAHPGPSPAAAAGDDPLALAELVRGRGGTVVAAGGCFDLLHAGHVTMLRAARALGDCLVVCLNSDASVRRLKGPDRPLQTAPDRAAVLRALDCVDAVLVFDEDTPTEALTRLRPDLFAKGADYAGADLPEAQALARWGGSVVAVPYLQGRSTTRLLEEAVRRAS